MDKVGIRMRAGLQLKIAQRFALRTQFLNLLNTKTKATSHLIGVAAVIMLPRSIYDWLTMRAGRFLVYDFEKGKNAPQPGSAYRRSGIVYREGLKNLPPYLVHPNFGVLVFVMWYGKIVAIQLWYQDRSLSAKTAWDFRQQHIVVGILLLENIHKLISGQVNPLLLRVIPFDIGCEVVEITILEPWDRDRCY